MKKETAKYIVPTSFLICIFFASFFIYYNFYDYKIENTDIAIKQSIVRAIFKNRSQFKTEIFYLSNLNGDKINLEKSISKENKRFILFSINSPEIGHKFLGHAIMQRGLNNKYKIESIGYGTNLNNNSIMTSGESVFLLLYGINYEGKVSTVILETDKQNYEIDVTGEEVYLKVFQLDKLNEDTNSIYTKWRLFDEDNNDITNEIHKEYNTEVLNF